jgi:hypothetical protein
VFDNQSLTSLSIPVLEKNVTNLEGTITLLETSIPVLEIFVTELEARFFPNQVFIFPIELHLPMNPRSLPN